MLKQARIYGRELRTKLRYGHPLQLFFDALSRVGIRIILYYLFEEIISSDDPPARPAGFEDYDVSFWGPEEIRSMALIPGRKVSEETLIKRLRDGHKCLGMKKGDALAAFTWCNLNEATLQCNYFLLKTNEAYLFDGYTLMAHRGNGIAPFLRYNLYKELQKLGRTKLYSYSNYFNRSAVKFKLKLDAKKMKLLMIVSLFRKRDYKFLLKDY